ncbi:MAG TPA: rod shape-determining protein MreC [Saprospiraceae bacterium]|nr:rod shape-determining protein MreC [Saprospiraceae bacterium]
MGKLLELLLRNGGFVTFLVVEVICFAMMVNFNTRQGEIWANTTGIFGGRALEKRQMASDYFNLYERADSLAHLVDSLQLRLSNARQVQVPIRDTFFLVSYDSLSRTDSTLRKTVRPQFQSVTARVIKNSVSGANNWLIINRGSSDGVKTDMAVLSPVGIVGIVRHVSPHFSLVMSVLHQQAKISAALPQQKNAFGSLTWDGGDPTVMTLRYIPQHFVVKENEPVVTSGYSLMFPQGHPVGKVYGTPKTDAENPYFLEIKVKLHQDMTTVRDVSVVQNLFQAEIDSLQLKIKANEQ